MTRLVVIEVLRYTGVPNVYRGANNAKVVDSAFNYRFFIQGCQGRRGCQGYSARRVQCCQRCLMVVPVMLMLYVPLSWCLRANTYSGRGMKWWQGDIEVLTQVPGEYNGV